MVLLRRLLGDVLRRQRLRQGRTLRDVSSAARVSLGYLSEVERGQKEASSELLHAICAALDLPLSEVLREVSEDLALVEALASLPTDVLSASASASGVASAQAVPLTAPAQRVATSMRLDRRGAPASGGPPLVPVSVTAHRGVPVAGLPTTPGPVPVPVPVPVPDGTLLAGVAA